MKCLINEIEIQGVLVQNAEMIIVFGNHFFNIWFS